MKEFWVILALVACVLFALPSFANIDSPYLGFNYDEVAGDSGWGLRGGTPFKTGVLEGHVEASFQNTGDILRGKSELEVGVPIGAFDVAVFSVNTVKGDALSNLGRQNDIGLKVGSPEAVFGSWQFTGSLGVFGRNGGCVCRTERAIRSHRSWLQRRRFCWTWIRSDRKTFAGFVF